MLVLAAVFLTLADFHHSTSIQDAQISPDGRIVAYVQGVPDFATDKYQDELLAVSVLGGAPQRIASGRPMLSSPRWSPAGTTIAYLATPKGGTAQVFVIAARGGTPYQLTHAKSDVEQFAWSPDGAQIAYVAQDVANSGSGVRVQSLFDVHNDGYLTSERPEPSHIWLISARGGTPRRLTAGSWSVLEAAPPFVGAPTDPAWSYDGRSIVFAKQADADDSDSDLSTVASVDVRTGAIAALGSHPKYEYEPVASADADAVAYLSPVGPGPISRLGVFVRRNGSQSDVTSGFDADVVQAVFVPKSDALLMLAPRGAIMGLWIQRPGNLPERIALGTLAPSSFSVARNGTIAFIASRNDLPSEVYVTSVRGAAPRRLTFAQRYFERFSYGRSEEISWTGPDGERSDGILTYPAGYVAGRTYPLVLRIHGGPEASSTIGFNLLAQLFAARGYLVFQPNYRGSDNLGSAHEHAIYRDPGTGPGNDVMAGIAAIEKLGIVDTSRIAVTGHSYGGYMTTWLIGHEHLWKAAVVGDGMVDWLEEYNDSAAGNLAWTRDSLGGTPADPSSAPLYRSGSPITYAAQITTPTLIISGTADETVPATESYELYHALADRGVPVRFVAIPGAHHSPSDPVHIEGYDRVTLDWLERYL
ncbi:MAG: S9 family peptidase [Candidatus Eremiobacteraeota bacterium]|nr:S9 family peptidase [Candidatus Eremiobacteraeota bacterium]